MPSIEGNCSRWYAIQSTRKSVTMVSSWCMRSGSVLIASRNSVVPIRNEATFNGPRATAKRILWPAFSISGCRCWSRLMTNGKRPCLRGSGIGEPIDLLRPAQHLHGEGKVILAPD